MNKYYLEYPFKQEEFNEKELKLIEHLKEAGKLIGEVFDKQVGCPDCPGGCFYPEDVTKEEILKASNTDSRILDPHTIVKRNANGKLYAVYYHEEFKEEMQKIASLFLEASKLTDNESFKNNLEVASKVYINGNYDDLMRAWIAVDSKSRFNVMTGPLGSYADRLFSLKTAFNFNFTYTSSESNFNPENYVDVIRNLLPHFGSKARQNVSPERIKIRVDNVLAIGGRNAALPARAVNYPEDIKLIEECGIKIVVYTNNIVKRDGGMLLPLFRDLMDKEVSEKFSDDEIMANAIRLVMSHEITEAIFQYPGSWDRLKGMFNFVFELHSSAVGIKACGYQVIKGVLTQKDLEAILYVMLMRTFSDYFVRKTSPQVENYLWGYRVFFNLCLEMKAIILEKDHIKVNASEMYVVADQLANKVMELYDHATEEEAKEFFDKYNSELMYEHFSDKLSKYDFK